MVINYQKGQAKEVPLFKILKTNILKMIYAAYFLSDRKFSN